MSKTELEWLMSQFHQDWDVEFDSWEAVVDSWVHGSTPTDVTLARSELSRILAAAKTEADLQTATWRLGCEYFAGEEPGGFRGWLTQVRDKLTPPQ